MCFIDITTNVKQSQLTCMDGLIIPHFLAWLRPEQLTHLSLASLLWVIGKQNSPRCDAAERGVPSGAILFAQRNFFGK